MCRHGRCSYEPAHPTLIRDDLQAKIAALPDNAIGYRTARPIGRRASVTDPDTRRMRTSQGSVIGYNLQAALDHKNKLIVTDDAIVDSQRHRHSLR